MSPIRQEDIQELSAPRDSWCVSIYLPTIEKSAQTRQNPIRFKNLLDQAEAELKEGGLKPAEAAALLEPAQALLRDELFWQHQKKGLAIFLSEDFYRQYLLPIDVAEQVVVGERFSLKPVVPLLNMQGDTFYVLALSQNEVRFFEASPHDIEQVDHYHLPKDMDAAMPEDNPERQVQFHTRTSTPGSANAGGERDAMFHGHGPGDEDKRKDLIKFFRMVDSAITDHLRGKTGPLVLAAVEEMLPIFREVNNYPHLFDQVVTGNFDGERPELLHRRAWELVEPVFRTSREDQAGIYQQLSGQGDLRAIKDVAEITKAAPYGRVEVLFVDKNAKQFGIFDENNQQVHLESEAHANNQDLLEFAAVQTLLNGGMVYAVDATEMPETDSPAVAILRY